MTKNFLTFNLQSSRYYYIQFKKLINIADFKDVN